MTIAEKILAAVLILFLVMGSVYVIEPDAVIALVLRGVRS